MKYQVFVDGQEGTTGLEIHERLKDREDVEVLKIDPAMRKDKEERTKYVNQADFVFLCLPDEAARESVSLVTNPNTRVIDASTAHRTADGWTYGIPELSAGHREAIAKAKRVSVPGCFATGFNVLLHPLVTEGIVPKDYPVTCHAVTGYSGGGRSLIERFESPENATKLRSPNFYALGLAHKHLPEMQKHSGLQAPPLFTPIVCNYYRGMTVAVPLFPRLLSGGLGAEGVHAFLTERYKGQKFVKVATFHREDELEWGFLNEEAFNHTNTLEISVFGNEGQILIVSRFDNLGKGASGAAIQNMNVMMGVEEGYGLEE